MIRAVLITAAVAVLTVVLTTEADTQPTQRASVEESKPPIPYHEKQGCRHYHTRGFARRRARRYYRSPSTYTPAEARLLSHIQKCQHSASGTRYVKKLRAKWRTWRRSYEGKWTLRYERLSDAAKGWTRSTSTCESGWPNGGRSKGEAASLDTGNGFLGAFQWLTRTWYAAGGDRHPTSAMWEHQAVLAWRWHLGHPSGQWPNCGE